MITVAFDGLNLPKPCRILDIGCGSGRHTAAAYGLDSAWVVGADLRIEDLRQARERLAFHDRLGARGCHSCWRLTGADLRYLPFGDHQFDLVICSEVLEHLRDHAPPLHELARVVTPNGYLVVSVPRKWPEAVCWFLSRAYRFAPGGHVRIVETRHLVSAMVTHGFHHYRTHFAHSLHSPYWWLKCLVGITREEVLPVKLYHRFLTWDIMARPHLTCWLDRLFNPIMGKSVVLYFRKQ